MTREDVREVPVLIVGAGPAGLVAAGTLARLGVPVLVAERRRELSGLPRATVISTRSMELLRSWGLEEEILGGGVDAELALWVCETLATAGTGSAEPVGLPSRQQSALVSPTAPAVVPQDHLEPVLLRHVRSLAGCRVLLGTELVRLDDRPDGIGAVLRDATGRTTVVRARYVIAADGAHSTVRTTLGIPMRGPEHLAEQLSVLFRAPLWKLLGDTRYVLYAVTRRRRGGHVSSGRAGRPVAVRQGLGPVDRAAGRLHPRPELPNTSASARGMPACRRESSESARSASPPRSPTGSGKAGSSSSGTPRTALSPRGGTGMNTAIQDGHDLGWKLGWVLRGWAGQELLDSYEAERRPVAEHNLTRSADPNGSIRSVDQETVRRPRRAHPAPLAAGPGTHVHARPARSGPDAVHGAVRSGPGRHGRSRPHSCRTHAAAAPPPTAPPPTRRREHGATAHGPATGRGHGAGDGNPAPGSTARPPRRRAGRLLAGGVRPAPGPVPCDPSSAGRSSRFRSRRPGPPRGRQPDARPQTPGHRSNTAPSGPGRQHASRPRRHFVVRRRRPSGRTTNYPRRRPRPDAHSTRCRPRPPRPSFLSSEPQSNPAGRQE